MSIFKIRTESSNWLGWSRILLNVAPNHIVLTFMHVYSNYNKILVVEKHTRNILLVSMAFRIYEWTWGTHAQYTFIVQCISNLWVDCHIVGLKNIGVTYQRVMNTIFHNFIGRSKRRCIFIISWFYEHACFNEHVITNKYYEHHKKK